MAYGCMRISVIRPLVPLVLDMYPLALHTDSLNLSLAPEYWTWSGLPFIRILLGSVAGTPPLSSNLERFIIDESPISYKNVRPTERQILLVWFANF